MWINVPQGATDAYVTALAGIIKNGGTVERRVAYPGLATNLKVYLEYSNEVWGGIPLQRVLPGGRRPELAPRISRYRRSPATPTSTTNADGSTTTDVYTALGRRYLERTAEIGQLFQNVFGADPSHAEAPPGPRLAGEQLPRSTRPRSTGSSTTSARRRPPSTGMGNANYWNPTDYSSVNSIISTLQQQETAYAVPNTVDFTTLATFYGLKNVSYEGGPSIGADGTNSDGSTSAAGQNALAASRDPRMEQLVLPALP